MKSASYGHIIDEKTGSQLRLEPRLLFLSQAPNFANLRHLVCSRKDQGVLCRTQGAITLLGPAIYLLLFPTLSRPLQILTLSKAFRTRISLP